MTTVGDDSVEPVPRAFPIAQVESTEEVPPNVMSLLKKLVWETVQSAESGGNNIPENIDNAAENGSFVINNGSNGMTLSVTAQNVSETFAVFQLLLELGWILVCLSKQFIYHLGDALETQYVALMKLLGSKKDQIPEAAIIVSPKGISAIFRAVGLLCAEIWQYISPLVAVLRIMLAFLVGLLLFATDQLIFRFIVPANITEEAAKTMKFDLFCSVFALLVGFTLCFLGGDISTVLVAVSALRSAALATSYAMHKRKQKLSEQLQSSSFTIISATVNEEAIVRDNNAPNNITAPVVNEPEGNNDTNNIRLDDSYTNFDNDACKRNENHFAIEKKIKIENSVVDIKTPEKFNLPPITPTGTPKIPRAPTSGLLDDTEEVAQQRAKHKRRTLLRQSLGMLDAMKTPLKSPLKPVTPVKPPFSTSMRPPSRRFSLRPTSIRSLTAAFRKESSSDDYSRLISESAVGSSPDVSSAKTKTAKINTINDASNAADIDKCSNKENESKLNDVSLVNNINIQSDVKDHKVANETNKATKDSEFNNYNNKKSDDKEIKENNSTKNSDNLVDSTKNKSISSDNNLKNNEIDLQLLHEPTDEELRLEREEALKHGDMWVALQTLRDDLQDVLLVLVATHHRPDVLRHIHDVLTLACNNANANNNSTNNTCNSSNENNNTNNSDKNNKSADISGKDSKSEMKLTVLDVAILVLQTVDPQRLSRALLILGSRLAAVLLTLRFSFAQTVALSQSLSSWLSRLSHVLLDRFVFTDLESSVKSSVTTVLNVSGGVSETLPGSTENNSNDNNNKDNKEKESKEVKSRRAFRGWMRFLFTCVAHGISLYIAWSLRRFLATLLAATQGFHYLVQNLNYLFFIAWNSVSAQGTQQEVQGTKQKVTLLLLKTLAQGVALCCAVTGVYIQWRYGWQHSLVTTPGSVVTLVVSQDAQHRWALPWVVRWCVAPLLWLERLLLAFVTYTSVASSSSLAPAAVDTFSAGTATMTPFANVVMPVV